MHWKSKAKINYPTWSKRSRQNQANKSEFENDREKEKVLANLGNLKDIDEYIGISITTDYSQSERRLIKEKAVEVKAINEKEPENSGYIWKLRGSLKNRLSIRRVPRMRPQKNM